MCLAAGGAALSEMAVPGNRSQGLLLSTLRPLPFLLLQLRTPGRELARLGHTYVSVY